MKLTETKLKGCFVLEPAIFTDSRGYFMESFNKKKFDEAVGSHVEFVQDNQSFSIKGVLRGLHYQIGDKAQAKLVSVLSGTVLDIAVDLRKNSATFGQHVTVELTSKNKKQMFIPKGFAHGFVVLSNTAEFFYKCDNYYDKGSENGIFYADPALNIDWGLPQNELIISEKDLILPPLEKARI